MQADLSALGLGPAVRLVSALRRLNADCASVEQFAQGVCAYLHECFVGPDGERQTALVRFYATAPLGELPPEDAAFVHHRFGPDLPGSTTCLSLLGTAGTAAAWNDRTRSAGHRVLPLVDVEQVTSMPMVAGLLRQLGIDLHALVNADPDVLVLPEDSRYRVFHVPVAVASPLVPDQGFVAEHGIASAFGFGGALPTGEVYAVVVFSRVPVPQATAELFGAVALSTSVAALEMLDLPVFSGQPATARAATQDLDVAARAEAREHLVRALLQVHERLAASEFDKAELALAQARYDAGRAAALATVALRMTSVRTVAEVTDVIVRDALPILRADGGAIALVDETGSAVTVQRSEAYGGIAGQRFTRLPLDDSLPIVWAARRNEESLVPDVASALNRFPAMAERRGEVDVRAAAAFPLVVDDRLLGSLAMTWNVRQVFSDSALELMRALAAQTAQALDRARLLERERRQSEALQRSFLSRPPLPAGVEVAVRYHPAAQNAQVGGDWHDAFRAGDGATLLAVGDVVGHDMLAAAAMGQVRTLLRGIAFSRPGRPATTLDLLEAAVAGLELGTIATVVLARLEAAEDGPRVGWQQITWSNAGHPPPVLRSADGTTTVLDGETDLMIGVEPDRPHSQQELLLEPGSSLVLYTDGLIERRGEDIDCGIERLRALVAELGALDLDALCDQLLTRMLPAEGAEDDVALLVVRLPGDPTNGRAVTEERSATLPSEAISARTARRLVSSLLHDTGNDRWRDAAELAVSEVVTNAVLHARSPIRLLATVDARQVRVEVRDDHPDLPTERHYDAQATTGRGMGLVAAVASSHGVRSLGPVGKVVWFTVGDDAQERSSGEDWPLTEGRPLEGSGSSTQLPTSAQEPERAQQDRRPGDLPVQLVGLPTTLWLAARQHHEAMLRELALRRLGVKGASALHLAEADAAHTALGVALDRALSDPRVTGGGRLTQPAGQPATLPEVAPTLDLVLSLAPEQASSFGALQDTLDEGERLAGAGQLLVRPSLPEVTAVRDWACEQVISQLSGTGPSPWAATDVARSIGLPEDRAHVGDRQDVDHVRDALFGAVAADDANRILAVSRPLADALGWEPEELVGRRIVALIPPRFREAHVAGFTRYLTTGEAHILGVELDLPVLRRDGSEVLCSLLIEASSTDGGRHLYTAMITAKPG